MDIVPASVKTQKSQILKVHPHLEAKAKTNKSGAEPIQRGKSTTHTHPPHLRKTKMPPFPSAAVRSPTGRLDGETEGPWARAAKNNATRASSSTPRRQRCTSWIRNQIDHRRDSRAPSRMPRPATAAPPAATFLTVSSTAGETQTRNERNKDTRRRKEPRVSWERRLSGAWGSKPSTPACHDVERNHSAHRCERASGQQ